MGRANRLAITLIKVTKSQWAHPTSNLDDLLRGHSILLITLCWNILFLLLHACPPHFTCCSSDYPLPALPVICCFCRLLHRCGPWRWAVSPASLLTSCAQGIPSACTLFSPRRIPPALSSSYSRTYWFSHFGCPADSSNSTVPLNSLPQWVMPSSYPSIPIQPATQAKVWWLPSTSLLLETSTH